MAIYCNRQDGVAGYCGDIEASIAEAIAFVLAAPDVTNDAGAADAAR